MADHWNKLLLNTFVENLVVDYLSPLTGKLWFIFLKWSKQWEKYHIIVCLLYIMELFTIFIISDIKKWSDNLHVQIWSLIYKYSFSN